MKSLTIGIASYADMKARTMAIARGELKPRPGEPEVWFASIESFAKVLSDRNRALLRLIMEEDPQSLTALARISGRAKSNLSRTLHTLERVLEGELDPVVDALTTSHQAEALKATG